MSNSKFRPVFETMTKYLLLTAAADMIEQFCIKKRTLKNYKYEKTLQISLTGGFVIGPMIHCWLHHIVEHIGQDDANKATKMMKKVAADSVFFAPCAISMFYFSTAILAGNPDIFSEWKQKFMKTWMTGLMYWPIIQGINFHYVPKHLKTSVYMPVCSFVWFNYLSYLKEQRVKPK